ncbi:hypothetical protein H6G74_26345 [Nostoc spongiaeforme FACHB-130]|uniref:Uncharacterized protein n=1 Tax=Nostoc spongiaeforme FACHB-130 TaxID=1357510 RepID=A0ABR8G3M4_9NOSO|nr:hypothetical protein [Nostoc spongiaeforme]MBD2597818.1 hypothetical protein [Nostoc spongiaeforme FACHB-130]
MAADCLYWLTHILHLAPANGIRGYTNEVRLRGLTRNQGFGTRAGGEGVAVLAVPVDCEPPNPKGFCLCSRDFSRLVQDMS